MKNFTLLLLILVNLVLLSCSTDPIDSKEELQINPPVNTTRYRIIMTGSVTTNNCGSTTDKPYNILSEFISDNSVIKSTNLIGQAPRPDIGDSMVLKGNVIGMRIKLSDFNPNNHKSGRGLVLTNVLIVILRDVDVSTVSGITPASHLVELSICNNSTYEIVVLYNTITDKWTITPSSHTFN
jgi:hypothetical protein